MARYRDEDEVDLVVIGAGAGGCTLAQRLARRGWRIVVLESGPFWDPDRDWVSDEAGASKLYWNEPRVIGGEDPVELGKNNSGHGVGGSMVHYAGYAPRFHPSDFRTRSLDGVGADWPISYAGPQARTTSWSRPSCRSRASTGRGGTRTATPTRRTRSPPARNAPARARGRPGSRFASGRSRSPTARSATARTASTVASACRAARSTRRPRR